MVCPRCGGKTHVHDNSGNNDTNENYRQRVCKECGYKFYTVEFEVEEDKVFKKSWWRNYRRSKK